MRVPVLEPGSIVIATLGTSPDVCQRGEVGVCIEARRDAWTFVFERGGRARFNRDEIERHLWATGKRSRIIEEVPPDQTATALLEDLRAGAEARVFSLGQLRRRVRNGEPHACADFIGYGHRCILCDRFLTKPWLIRRPARPQ